jgi:hypothetical protein
MLGAAGSAASAAIGAIVRQNSRADAAGFMIGVLGRLCISIRKRFFLKKEAKTFAPLGRC